MKAKENKHPDKDTASTVSIYAQYDMNIPAHKKAMDNLEEYQRQTGLSLKQALVFILLASDPAQHQPPDAAWANVTQTRKSERMEMTDQNTDQNTSKFSDIEEFPDMGIY